MSRELDLRRPDILDSPHERKEADHLVASQTAFTQAFHEARTLGREMVERMDRMDAARKELEKHGVFTMVEFQPELQAAYRSVRRLLGDGSELDVPTFLRS